MNKRELTCISCPIGCRLEVTTTDQGYIVSGNQCKRGETYGISEVTAPTRALTSTVRTNSNFLRRLPVRTDKPMPKEMMSEAMIIINKVNIEVPIKAGDIIIEKLLGTDVNIIASRSTIE